MPPRLTPREKYVPKHRRTSSAVIARRAPGKVLRTTVLCSSVAVAATGGAVSAGLVSSPIAVSSLASATVNPSADRDPVDQTSVDGQQIDRPEELSRSAGRDESRDDQATDQATAQTATEQVEDPRELGRELLPEYGFSQDQFPCLDALYESESGWQVDADNPTSSAYGIPQALTETHDLPPGYMTSPEVQIRWGLSYIQDSYGTPCSAWEFKQGNNWY